METSFLFCILRYIVYLSIIILGYRFTPPSAKILGFLKRGRGGEGGTSGFDNRICSDEGEYTLPSVL